MMKPPICIICNRRFNPQEEGGIIYFKKRESDKEWDEREIVEHPPYAEWFCKEHIIQAENLSGLIIDEAMNIMLKK